MHFKITGKGGEIRFIPIAPLSQKLITEYLDTVGQGKDLKGPLFRPVRNNTMDDLNRPLHPVSIYKQVVRYNMKKVGLDGPGYCEHSARATTITNTLDMGPTRPRFRNGPDIQTFLQRGCMISAKTGLRIARVIRSGFTLDDRLTALFCQSVTPDNYSLCFTILIQVSRFLSIDNIP